MINLQKNTKTKQNKKKILDNANLDSNYIKRDKKNETSQLTQTNNKMD